MLTQRCAADFADGVGVTEIDRHIAIFHARRDWITQIALRNNLDLWIRVREIGNRFAHAPGCTDEQQPHVRLHLFRSNSSSVLRKRA